MKSSQIKDEDEDYSDSFEDIQYEKEEGSVQEEEKEQYSAI